MRVILIPQKEVRPLKKIRKDKSADLYKTYITQPISQADSRQQNTGVAMPNDANVESNREWVEENKK